MKADNYHTDVQWFDLLDATRVSVSEGVPFRHGELYQKKKNPYFHWITMNESREPRLTAHWNNYKRFSSCRHGERSEWGVMRISKYNNVR